MFLAKYDKNSVFCDFLLLYFARRKNEDVFTLCKSQVKFYRT